MDKYKGMSPKAKKPHIPYWKIRSCHIKKSYNTKEEAISFAEKNELNQKPVKCRVCNHYHLATRKATKP